MFIMEETSRFEDTATHVMGLAIASGAEQATFNNIRTLLDAHHKNIAFGSWSVDSLKEKKQAIRNDKDILEQVDKLGELGNGRKSGS
jgi:hypothetical protein